MPSEQEWQHSTDSEGLLGLGPEAAVQGAGLEMVMAEIRSQLPPELSSAGSAGGPEKQLLEPG